MDYLRWFRESVKGLWVELAQEIIGAINRWAVLCPNTKRPPLNRTQNSILDSVFKLAVMEWFFYNLVILIKLYKIWYLNSDETILFPRNQAFCLKNWKLWWVPATAKFNIFLLKFCTRFLLNNIYKRTVGNFFILFRSWVIIKNVKNECVENRSFVIFANNSRSKQNKTNPEHRFVDIGK